jgi:hypothetical protein
VPIQKLDGLASTIVPPPGCLANQLGVIAISGSIQNNLTAGLRAMATIATALPRRNFSRLIVATKFRVQPRWCLRSFDQQIAHHCVSLIADRTQTLAASAAVFFGI